MRVARVKRVTIMQSAAQSSAYWPAQIIHVNEDGWALINRGATHGVSVGTRLLVVGDSMRDLRDLFAPSEVREGDDLTEKGFSPPQATPFQRQW